MILDGFRLTFSAIGYQFHFGLESHFDVDLDDFCDQCPFKQASSGCYHTSKDKMHSCSPEDLIKSKDASAREKPVYIPMYQKNVQRRIRPLFRQFRDTLLIELKSIPLEKLTIANNHVLSATGMKLQSLLSLQKIGVGSVSIWVEGLDLTDEDQLIQIRDPRLLSVVMAAGDYDRTKWPVMDFVRYLILLSHQALAGQEVDHTRTENHHSIKSDNRLDNFLTSIIPKYADTSGGVKVEIDNHPFFMLQYDLSSDELQRKFREHPHDIRLPLCGDRNWKLKNDSIVKDTITKANVSSRDSILWIANPEGTVKFWSSELETPIQESMTATLLETDIVLTMRYFLQTIGLLAFRLSSVNLSPTKLSKIRQKLFIDIDKYCNINVSHKDTTRRRLESLKSRFQVDEMYEGLVARLDLVSTKLSTAHSASVERQQLLLTLVFAFFGAFTVLDALWRTIHLTVAGISISAIVMRIMGAVFVTGIVWLISLVAKRVSE